MKTIRLLTILAAALLASCAVPASPQVTAHAADSTSPQGMAAASQAQSNFWH